MLIRFSVLALMAAVVHVTCVGQLTADSNEKVLQAWRSGIKSGEDFAVLHKFIVGDATTQKWQEIDWYSNLLEARDQAKKQNRPLFIWAMNGNPLGCV